MTTELKADLLLWKELVFENQFAGVPMTMFGTAPPELDGWVIVHSNNSSQITAVTASGAVGGPGPEQQSWNHIRLYVQTGWEFRLLDTMNSRDPEAQQQLSSLALAQAR
ncbi:hypothetical protein Pcac1_g8640 [Phytophthora cactorum]|nr:hypothetical protein Pcac1_g8640 [Phytophthora cactorum]